MKQLNIDLQIEVELDEAERKAVDGVYRSLQAAAKVEGLPPVEISVMIIDNERMQEINREYRHVDRPTDVLSFSLWERDEEWMIDEEEEIVLLGDILLSLPKAQEQAETYGHSLERELGFLAVHGFLHLLGYDHESEEEEKEMFRKQEEILNQVDLHR